MLSELRAYASWSPDMFHCGARTPEAVYRQRCFSDVMRLADAFSELQLQCEYTVHPPAMRMIRLGRSRGQFAVGSA
jgi:hypothetical protein